jgi:type IV secretory pathway TraG/TraD family ATPase VirD4
MEDGENIAKPKATTGLTILAQVNLALYTLLLFWALSLLLHMFSFIAAGLVLYSVAGVGCAWGLLQHKRWGWYMAVTMWILEGAVSSCVAYVNSVSLSINLGTAIMFLIIALFRFASTAYLAKKKIRDTFSMHSESSVHKNTQTTADQFLFVNARRQNSLHL